MCLLTNNKQISLERDYLNSYLKTKPSDCVLYSEDGAKFDIHKDIFSQTKFMREILSSAKDHCCSTLEIICPCTNEELENLIHFLYNGEIHCEDDFDCYIVQEDLIKIFGYPEFLNVDGQIISLVNDPALSSILNTAELTLLTDTDLNINFIGDSTEIGKNFEKIDQSASNELETGKDLRKEHTSDLISENSNDTEAPGVSDSDSSVLATASTSTSVPIARIADMFSDISDSEEETESNEAINGALKVRGGN